MTDARANAPGSAEFRKESPAETHAYPHGDPSHWSLYRQTTLRTVLGDEAVAIDLSKPLSEATAHRLADAHGAWFAILTAFNPRFLSEGRNENREQGCDNLARHAALGDELARRGLAHAEADGHANSEPGHIEKGYLTRCDEATATEISCAHGQDAFFAFDGRHFWILPALERSMGRVRLP